MVAILYQWAFLWIAFSSQKSAVGSQAVDSQAVDSRQSAIGSQQSEVHLRQIALKLKTNG